MERPKLFKGALRKRSRSNFGEIFIIIEYNASIKITPVLAYRVGRISMPRAFVLAVVLGEN
jgi:hypothetical protein